MPYSPEKQAAWREDNRDYQRDYNLRRNYGISLAEYDRLVSLQCGACAICGQIPSEDPGASHNQGRLHVDHDHETGKIRGLLCLNCNRGIGLLGDDSEMLQRAALYLADRG